MLRRGRWNSSLTRVRPVFGPLLARRPSEPWLRALLAACPHADSLPADVLADPGELLPHLAELRSYPDKILGPIPLEAAFEYEVPPPEAFLRHLLTHPGELSWPLVAGKRKPFSEKTMQAREALIDGSAEASSAIAGEGLAELKRRGVKAANARPKPWWSFEGFTEVDCCLETERLVLFIEGKRKEALSESTSWFRGRNQLIRNLEAIGEIARGRACGVLLVCEKPVDELDDRHYQQALPHLNPAERRAVRDRYLGQLTWERVCDAVGIPFASLPPERPPS